MIATKPPPSAHCSLPRGNSRILAAGLTPAWQQIVVLDRLRAGQVNRAREVHWCASGKVLNVGLALHYLGAQAKTLCLVGGLSGDAIQAEFKRLQIETEWTRTQTATRICTTILAAAECCTTELAENSPAVSAEDLDAFQAAFASSAALADIAVLSGSLPQGAPVTYYRDLIQSFSGRVILDARGGELLEALASEPFLVKPNQEELARTLGVELRNEGEIVQAMRQLNRLGAEWVVITRGKEAVLATGPDQTLRLIPPEVLQVVNPIACGDCLAAGIAWALQQGRTSVEAIRWGMAAAADNLGQLLPARLNPERVAHWERNISLERIQ